MVFSASSETSLRLPEGLEETKVALWILAKDLPLRYQSNIQQT